MATTNAPPGWRNRYQGFEYFPRLAFAWEYLRRNESFQETCRDAQQKIRVAGEWLNVFEGRRSGLSGDCLFTASADEDARSATVFWKPEVCPKVLRLLALPVQKGTKPFALTESALQTSLFVTEEGAQHVLIRDGVRTLQLCVCGESLLHPVTLALDTGLSSPLLAYQERMLSCFHAYRSGQGLLQRYFPADPHATRLTFVLRALDGWLTGVPQREIATALYGRARVERDWRDPNENLRDQIRHAIVRGRALMDRGYGAFLC